MKTGLTIGLSLVALAAVSSEVGMWASAPDIQRERSAVEDSSRVGGWLDAVDRHVPTEIDAAATDIAAWPKDQLIPVLTALGRLNSAGAINHVLIRGAVLHTDVALGGLPAKATGPLVESKGRRTGDILVASDGREQGASRLSFHLDFARALVDLMKPRPSHISLAGAWYRAVSAMLARVHNHADAVVHLRRARELFPLDADILFDSGCLYETFAAPPIQAVVQSTALTRGSFYDFPSQRASAAEAVRYFRRAIEIRPGFAEARVHLARLTGAGGDHRQAIAELERAIRDTTDPVVLYYAWLFLGNEQQAIQRFNPARTAYQQALKLFPESQSPAFALSQLERRLGDRRAASEAISRALRLPQPDNERRDPWWRYYEGSARNARALFAQLRSLS
jgi:tetratricopeptide (TPR) repeat protein